MTPLLKPLTLLSLIALLLIDGASAWHAEIRDHDMLAFGHSRRATVATKREPNTTATSRRKGGAHLESQSQSRSWHILHSATSPQDSDYSHTVDDASSKSSKSTPKYSKQQETRTPFVRGDNHDNTTAEEENEMDLFAATDMTASISDFGSF